MRRDLKLKYLMAKLSKGAELLSGFIVHLAHFMKRVEGTIKAKLTAVRDHHITGSFQDLPTWAERVWLALARVKRLGLHP